MFYVLFISILIALLITLVYSNYFLNKNKIFKREMFKNVCNSGNAITEITSLFGIISFKNDLNEDKNIICYSYREKINKGSRVLITDYDFEKEMYIVDEYPKI